MDATSPQEDIHDVDSVTVSSEKNTLLVELNTSRRGNGSLKWHSRN